MRAGGARPRAWKAGPPDGHRVRQCTLDGARRLLEASDLGHLYVVELDNAILVLRSSDGWPGNRRLADERGAPCRLACYVGARESAPLSSSNGSSEPTTLGALDHLRMCPLPATAMHRPAADGGMMHAAPLGNKDL